MVFTRDNGLLVMLVHLSFIFGNEIEREGGCDHDVRSSGQLKNLSVIKHFLVRNRSRSFIRLYLCLQFVLIFWHLFSVWILFILARIIINLVDSFLLIRMECGSDVAIVLEVWINRCLHIFRQLNVSILAQEIVRLCLFDSLTKDIILTCSFIINSRRNVNLLRERIEIFKRIFRSFGADELFKLSDVILFGFQHRVNFISFRVLILEEILINGVFIFVNFAHKVLRLLSTLSLLGKFTFNLRDLGLRIEFMCIFTLHVGTAIKLSRFCAITCVMPHFLIWSGKPMMIGSKHFLKGFRDILLNVSLFLTERILVLRIVTSCKFGLLKVTVWSNQAVFLFWFVKIF